MLPLHPYDPPAALHSLALATAQGLAGLHSAQPIHGTLAPEGVLLTGDRALLADPGLIPANEVHDAEGSVIEGPGGLERVPLQLRGVVDACLRENANLRPSAVDLVSMLGGVAAASPWPPELVSVVESSAAAMKRALPTEAAPEPGGQGRFLELTAGTLALGRVPWILSLGSVALSVGVQPVYEPQIRAH